MASGKELETPVLHVIVVGFHHKKGCQVEYSYPPVIAGNAVDSHELPEEWKHLPSLALPDGAHNYQNDTVFFHLPCRDSSKKTVYCVSCYRQIDAKDLLNKTADITRSTVQKSVCVLSRLPLYGLLKAKLELITHAYFDERDFSKVELLEQTFNNLNASLTESLLNGTQVFLSLSPREAVARFKHKLMVLFKLLLLERRVLFFGSPVEVLGTTLLSVLSLYPGMLEFGLAQAVCDDSRRLVSPTMGVTSLDPGDGGTGEDFVEVRYHHSPDEETAGVKSELSELMPYIHNSPMAAEPPESPTIPRDIVFSGQAASASDSSEKVRKDSENGKLQISDSSWSSTNSDHVTVSSSTRRKSGLEVHKPNHHHQSVEKTNSSNTQSPAHSSAVRQDSAESACHSASEATHRTAPAEIAASPSKHSPLEDVCSLTHISAVQTGCTIPNQQEAVEDFIHRLDMMTGVADGKGDLTVPGENSDHLLTQSDSVEELDSPESISKIDREDCFSWEEDRLQLSLAVDMEESSAVDSPSSHQSDASPDEQGVSQTDSQSSDHVSKSSDNSQKSGQSSSSSSKASSVSQKKSGRLGSPAKSSSPGRKTTALKNKLSTAFGKVKSRSKDVTEVKMKPVMKGEVSLQQDDFGFPLAIFTKGCVCHPYLSLQFHSILNDVNIRSFVLGATNILFRQQKQATDVVVEVEDGKLEIKDKELQKQVNLTTADLRFSELLVRQVTEERSNMYLDGTEWEGSDEWVRAQFRSYLQSLLATMLTEDSKLLEDFGLSFISAWRTTHNFRHWQDTRPHPKMDTVPAGHPFQGNLSVTDVRMRLNHSMQSTERGRKINAAVVQTGKYVMQTGKVVGGAFSSARSAVSSWFTSITNDWRHEEEEEEHQAGGEEESEDGQKDAAEEDKEPSKKSDDSNGNLAQQSAP